MSPGVLWFKISFGSIGFSTHVMVMMRFRLRTLILKHLT